MPNPVVRWQVIAPDADSTATFYQKLFGWTVSQDNSLGYREIRTGAGGIDGGVWPGPPQLERPFVQLFVEVDDLDAAIADAVKLGATVIVPKSVLPDGDAMAVLHDPAGLSFAVCTARRS
jgi:uncharacterized protein